MLSKLRYSGRVARLMAANWRDAITAGSWAGRQALRGGFGGLGWFLIVGTPTVYLLQEVGVLSGPKIAFDDLVWGVGFVLGGISLVALNRLIPRKGIGLGHAVLSERDEHRRYVAVCSCGWTGPPQDTVEGLLLEARAHKNVRMQSPES